MLLLHQPVNNLPHPANGTICSLDRVLRQEDALELLLWIQHLPLRPYSAEDEGARVGDMVEAEIQVVQPRLRNSRSF